MRNIDTQLIGVINQHRNAIIALEAIIASIPKQAPVDAELVKQNVRASKVFGEQDPDVYDAAEAFALRILSQA